MHFSRSLVLTLFASSGFVVSDDNFSLYAYGNEFISGERLFYADGYAYVGDGITSFASQAINVTFSLTDDSRFEASPSGDVSWTASPSLYIGPEDNGLRTVGFVSDYKNISDGVIVTGFGLFGGYAYNSAAGSIEMNFVASPTNYTGVYQIKWTDKESEVSETVISIALRTAAPAVPSD